MIGDRALYQARSSSSEDGSSSECSTSASEPNESSDESAKTNQSCAAMSSEESDCDSDNGGDPNAVEQDAGTELHPIVVDEPEQDQSIVRGTFETEEDDEKYELVEILDEETDDNGADNMISRILETDDKNDAAAAQETQEIEHEIIFSTDRQKKDTKDLLRPVQRKRVTIEKSFAEDHARFKDDQKESEQCGGDFNPTAFSKDFFNEDSDCVSSSCRRGTEEDCQKSCNMDDSFYSCEANILDPPQLHKNSIVSAFHDMAKSRQQKNRSKRTANGSGSPLSPSRTILTTSFDRSSDEGECQKERQGFSRYSKLIAKDDDSAEKYISRLPELLVMLLLSAVIVVVSTIGTSYCGTRLALRGKTLALSSSNENVSVPSESSDFVPPLGEQSTTCSSGESLFHFEIEFDSKPIEVGLSLRDSGQFGAGIWVFDPTTFRSFSQFKRKNVFDICLSSASEYEIQVTDTAANGLVSDLGGEASVFGRWTIAFDGTSLVRYEGDCASTAMQTASEERKHCGAYCKCTYVVSIDSNEGLCESTCPSE